MTTSSRGHLGIDDEGNLVRFGHVRRGRGSYPKRLGPMADRATEGLVPQWLMSDYRELLDLWHDRLTYEDYRAEVRRTYYGGLS